MGIMGQNKKAVHNNNKPVWADKEIRLDPYALPQKISYQRPLQRGKNAARASKIEFTLNTKGAVVKSDLSCGLPLSLSLPNNAFLGVAAQAFENEDGSNTVILELKHKDPELSVPLCVCDIVEDAASDWHSWAKQLGMPMLIVDSTGTATVVKDYAALSSLAPKPRRRRASFLPQRPYFLRRRKMGMVGPVVCLTAKEIIARH